MAIIKRKKEDPEARYIKGLIVEQLLKEGHKTFAQYIANPKLYLRLTDDPNMVAAISEKTGEIFLNRYFTDMAAISMLIRHELLHKMFAHEKNTMKIIAKQLGLDYDTLDDLTLGQLRELAYAPTAFEASLQNLAGDYHLSQYYTQLDRLYVNSLDFYGQKIQGLLIDQLYDDNPYGVKLDKNDIKKYSFEDLYNMFDASYNKMLWDAYEHIYGDVDDEGNFIETKPTHDLYLGTNHDYIVFITDEQSEAKKLFNNAEHVYHTLIPDYLSDQIEQDINNNADKITGMSIDDFKQDYRDFPLEEIDKNLNTI